MSSISAIIYNFMKIYAVFYTLLISSYAYEHFRIEYLMAYWSIMPDDIFKEEILDILLNYDTTIHIIKNDECEFIEKSRELYKKNQNLRIKLFKSGLKNRFIQYFKINNDNKDKIEKKE